MSEPVKRTKIRRRLTKPVRVIETVYQKGYERQNVVDAKGKVRTLTIKEPKR